MKENQKLNSILITEGSQKGDEKAFFSSISSHLSSGITHELCQEVRNREMKNGNDQISKNWDELKHGDDSNLELFKIFTSSPLTQDQLESLFSHHIVVNERLFKAYPNFTKQRGMKNQILKDDENLHYLTSFQPYSSKFEIYYLNSLERDVSAMVFVL